MSDKKRYQLDNAAHVFTASCNKRDRRTERISCTLKEDVDPEALQQALDETIKVRKQFQVHIKRGFFWYYFEECDTKPVVTKEEGNICQLLYHPNKPDELHYCLKYYKNRISLEIFHALCDGTGALEFLNNIILAYLKIKHTGLAHLDGFGSTSSEELFEDSFKKYAGKTAVPPDPFNSAFHNPGKTLPSSQTQIFDIHMPLTDVISLAKQANTSLTSYLCARIVLAFVTEISSKSTKKNINLSLPVNLRNYFPSHTARNFFNGVTLSHTYTGDETIESIASELRCQMDKKLENDSIQAHMNYYVGVQQHKMVRHMPLFLKRILIKFISNLVYTNLSAITSNMGAVKIPEEMERYIDHYCFIVPVTSKNIMFAISSFKDHLILNVSTPYRDNVVIRNLIRGLKEDGIKVTVNATGAKDRSLSSENNANVNT